MADNSKIQWTDSTWNPWHGCRKISDGCKYCYMFRDKERYGQDTTTVSRSITNYNAPLKWKEGRRIFTCSWSDFFIEEADSWRKDAWKIIKKTPQHTYQILTKRAGRIYDKLPHDWDMGFGYPHVWLGVSVESEKELWRIEELAKIPAAVKFVSFEPLLGPIDLNKLSMHFRSMVDWVIIGGESGNKSGKYLYRECRPEWMLNLIKQSSWNRVPVFVKQLGTDLANIYECQDRHGGNIDEWPAAFRFRLMPDGYRIINNTLDGL